MCIRDRRIGDVGGEEADLGAAVEAAALEFQPVELLRGHQSVSYTHLRAHETVLDLVCRLLLEKKKDSNLNTSQQDHDRNYIQKLIYIYIVYPSYRA